MSTPTYAEATQAIDDIRTLRLTLDANSMLRSNLDKLTAYIRETAPIHARVANWKPADGWSGSEPWLPLLFLMEAAWSHDYGSIVHDGNRVTFITGGWSENEDLIAALETNVTASSMLWLESHRGGKYVFVVKE